MTFQRSCLYHPKENMRVIEADQEDEYKRLLATGVWFDHPTKAKEMRDEYEKQIRQHPREGRTHGEQATKPLRSRTQRKKRICEKVQSEQARHAGTKPMMEPDMMDFCSYMSNNGAHAQKFGKKLTEGLDKVAFPVDGEGDDS